MKKFFLQMPDDLHRKVKIEALRLNLTMTSYITSAILSKLVNEKPERKDDD